MTGLMKYVHGHHPYRYGLLIEFQVTDYSLEWIRPQQYESHTQSCNT
jgi:hypothetical protein